MSARIGVLTLEITFQCLCFLHNLKGSEIDLVALSQDTHMGQEDREGCGSPAVNTGLHGSVVEGHWAQVAASSHALPKGLERSRGAAASFPHTGQVGAWGSRGQHPVGQGAVGRHPGPHPSSSCNEASPTAKRVLL